MENEIQKLCSPPKKIEKRYIDLHSVNNKSKFLTAIKNILNSEIEDFLKVEMISAKTEWYKKEMDKSISLFC